MHISDGFVHPYLDTDSIKKKNIYGITDNNCSLKKLIFDGLFFNDQFVGNIITDKFTYKKMCQTKNIYRHNLVDTYIGDFIHITEGMKPSVIYILFAVFLVIFSKLSKGFNPLVILFVIINSISCNFLNYLKLSNELSRSVILSIICLIF